MVLTCALPFMVAVFITITHLAPPPGQGSAFLSAVLQNGELYPAAALALVLPVVLAVTFTAYATGIFLLGPSRAAAVGQAPGGAGAGGTVPGAVSGIAGQAPTAGQAAGGAVTSLSGAPLSL